MEITGTAHIVQDCRANAWVVTAGRYVCAHVFTVIGLHVFLGFRLGSVYVLIEGYM